MPAATTTALLAAVPIVLLVTLLVGVRLSAARAGGITLIVTVMIAVVAFDPTPGSTAPGAAALGLAAESLFVTATIVMIVLPALAIHDLGERTGAMNVLRDGLTGVAPDPRLAAILVAWFFALFVEGAAGFGTPVALAAPFLVALGLRPIEAIVAALVGHVAGVAFGAVGTPVLVQAELSGIAATELARAVVPLVAVLGCVPVLVMAHLTGRALPGGRLPIAWPITAGLLFVIPQSAIAWFVGAELPTLAGALVGAGCFVAVLHRWSGAHEASVDAPLAPPALRSVVRAASPYLVLVALVLVTRLIGPVQDALRDVELRWSTAGGFGGSLQPLYHPGTLLLVSFLAGAAILRVPRSDVAASLGIAARRTAPAAVGLLALIATARTMSVSGMTDELAAVASSSAVLWPLVAPLIGALGTFMTGSATASNVLFTDLQSAAADASGLPVEPLLGAQTFGAAIGNAVAPQNVLAAAAIVGVVGREGDALRRTLPMALPVLGAAGAITWLLT